MLPFLSAILPTVSNVLDRVIPDKAAAEKAKQELALLAAKGELDNMAGQLRINAEEAKNPSLFVAGWRPCLGWIGAFAIGAPYFVWVFNMVVRMAFPEVPEITKDDMPDGGQIMPVVLGMLGLGGARTWERMKGVERNRIGGKADGKGADA